MYDESLSDAENICNAIDGLAVKVNTMNKYLHDLNESVMNLGQSVEFVKNGEVPSWDSEAENHIEDEDIQNSEPTGKYQ